jgi:hypothetical protein
LTPEGQAIRRLADETSRDRVLRARQKTPQEKLSAGSKLFEYAAGITLTGICAQNPGVSEQEARRILAQRLALVERMEKWARTSKQPP